MEPAEPIAPGDDIVAIDDPPPSDARGPSVICRTIAEAPGTNKNAAFVFAKMRNGWLVSTAGPVATAGNFAPIKKARSWSSGRPTTMNNGNDCKFRPCRPS